MAVETKNDQYISYPMFKGLQKPLEFMGIQGRYITWAAIAVGGAILGFIVVYCFLGFVAGLIVLAVSKKGLHTKKEDRGVFIYAYSTKM